MMDNEIPVLILNTSVAKTWRSPLYMETESYISKRLSNDDVLSYIITRHRSRSLFITFALERKRYVHYHKMYCLYDLFVRL